MAIRTVQQLHKMRQDTNNMEKKPNNGTNKTVYATHGGEKCSPNPPLMTYIQVARTINTYRINDIVDKSLINEPAGFRGGKSCTGPILNLTQNIKNGYEKKLVTGAVSINLTAAYDTINHRIHFKKMYEIISDYNLTSFIADM